MFGGVLPVSVLDLAPIVVDGTPAQALRNSVDLVRRTERLGYTRYWVAEHHNLNGIASAATSVVIAHLAQATETIRVGAGGVMLPNHAPLVIAEQFGTLEAFHPGRIDLGLGRAPGTDRVTLRALRQDPSADSFPQDVLELQALLGDPQPGQTVFAIPGVGSHVPLWILGSSLYGAQLAAALGLPYAFASHFAPDPLLPALEVYRARFQPSAQLQEPYAMVAVNVIAADDDATAAAVLHLGAAGVHERDPRRSWAAAAPIDDIEAYWSSRREGPRLEHAEPLVRRIAGHRARGPRMGHCRDRGGRADRRRRDPRPRGASPLLRDSRGSPTGTTAAARRLKSYDGSIHSSSPEPSAR